MAKMRVVQVPQAKVPFELVEREIPEPRAGSVRIKVQACGICHSDSYTKDGLVPGIQYPRVPGHEVIGIVDAVGANVRGWTAGQRVEVGWHGGNCGYCDTCRRGDPFACETESLVTGITSDSGYADFMIARAETLARVPEDLSNVDAAPLMCAGITTFNALRNSGARPGETVAVIGLGGLGHLGVQCAVKLGFRTVAIARGQDKVPLAHELGRGPGGSPAKARRRQDHLGDSDERRGNELGARRPRGQRHIDGDRGCRIDHNRCPCAAPWAAIDQGLVFRHLDRLARNSRLQRADRRAANDRNHSRWNGPLKAMSG